MTKVRTLARLMAAAALFALAACNQTAPTAEQTPAPEADGPVLNAPSEQEAAAAEGQAMLSSEERAQLEGLVRSYLDNAQQRFGQGLNPAPGIGDEVTSLQPGRDHRWQVNLAAGTNYRVIGGCDNECSNLDIEIIDARGAVAASDLAPDDFPVVNFTPAANGTFTIRVMMQACSVAPCYAGARVLTAPTT